MHTRTCTLNGTQGVWKENTVGEQCVTIFCEDDGTWNETQAGFTAIKPCGGGLIGSLARPCDQSGSGDLAKASWGATYGICRKLITGAPTGAPVREPSKSPQLIPTYMPSISPSQFPSLPPSETPTHSPTSNCESLSMEGSHWDGFYKKQRTLRNGHRWWENKQLVEIYWNVNPLGQEYWTIFGHDGYMITHNDNNHHANPPGYTIWLYYEHTSVFLARSQHVLKITCYETGAPTFTPTTEPTDSPTHFPTLTPSASPSSFPSISPSLYPSFFPSISPSTFPSAFPSKFPTASPTTQPTPAPTTEPTTEPSLSPTTEPTTTPSTAPTTEPTTTPSNLFEKKM